MTLREQLIELHNSNHDTKYESNAHHVRAELDKLWDGLLLIADRIDQD